MKTSKIFLILSLFFCFAAEMYGQTHFVYDAAGNMTGKTRITINYRKGTEDNKTAMIKGKYELKVFPNPVQDLLKLEITNLGNDVAADMKLYNMSGILLTKSDKLTSSNVYDLSGYSAGVYFMRLVIDGAPVEIKILKE